MNQAGDDAIPWERLMARCAYAVVDAAREPKAPDELRERGASLQSLYEGRLGDLLKNVAPFLVYVPPAASLPQWWSERRGRSVGILIESTAKLEELRRHFRTLLIVRGQDRSRYYFRFYDPRVLRVFLPACTAEEVKRFFGPVSAFHCEGSRADELLTFTPAPQGVKMETRLIAAAAAART